MRKKIFKIFGLLSPTIAYMSIALAILKAPSFSWTKNALSDLGVIENSALLFNSGLMISAVFMFIFGIGLVGVFKGLLGMLGITFYLSSSVALFAIGLFPENTGLIHFYVSIAFFCFLSLALILLGYSSLKHSKTTFGSITLALGIFTALVWIFPWSSAAIPELITSTLGALWTVHTAINVLR
ncbi:MAG: DUF998 domain-containing protein [Candidatus Bathyarchaeia archaeon]